MSNKRKAESSKSSSKKTKLDKGSFLEELKKFKLYSDEDKFYKDAKITKGPLLINW